MIHWQLTSQQYEAALFAVGRDRLPYPTWNALRAEDGAELDRHRRAAIESLVPRVDDDFARLVQILTDPRIRIHMHGRADADPRVQVRGYAGFGAGVAAVAIQAPDPGPGLSGDVTVSLCSHRQACLLLARMLPEVGPGRHELAEQKADLGLEPDWIGNWNRPPTGGERVRQFFSRPRVGWGEILCYTGAFLDNRTDGVQGFLWMDFARDGRYYVREDEHSYVAAPMAREQFAERIAAIVRRGGQ